MMSKNHEDFRNKYKIDVKYENCVINPAIFKKTKENNLAIAKLLTEKYGDVWKKDLEIILYGL
jgi:dihydropteroate synthase